MTKHFTYCIIGAGLLLLPIQGMAKGNKNKTNPLPVELQKADEDYNNGHYYEAIPLYRQAYRVIKFDSIKETRQARADIVFKIGECYRQIYNPKMEVKWYGKAIDKKCSDSLTAISYLKEAQAQMNEQTASIRFQHYRDSAYVKPHFDTVKVKNMCNEKRDYRKGIFVLCLDTDYTPMPHIGLKLFRSRGFALPDPDDVVGGTDGSGTCMMGKRKYFLSSQWVECSRPTYAEVLAYKTDLGENYVCMHLVQRKPQPFFLNNLFAVRLPNDRVKKPIPPPVKSGVRIVMHEDKN